MLRCRSDTLSCDYGDCGEQRRFGPRESLSFHARQQRGGEERMGEMIDRKPFGRTGHMSTRTLFGAWALQAATPAEADQTLQVLLEYGVNHIDTAASYGNAESLIGPWMDRHRQHFFLATKTDERTRQKAWDQLHLSLERLRTDRVDLWQLHHLVDPGEWETAMGPGGALEAAVEARERGLVRFIGVTGHGTTAAAMHRRSLERFDFDSVLLPYNYLMTQNPQYKADFDSLVVLCQDRNVAMQTIKSIARRAAGEGRLAAPMSASSSSEQLIEPIPNTWYPPLTAQEDIDQAVHWVLGHQAVFLNTAGDMRLLPKVLDAASRFRSPPPDEVMEQQVAGRQMIPVFPESSDG
jgi:aryl-alcohol dehydrogenase-like predicted oxidoreductase